MKKFSGPRNLTNSTYADTSKASPLVDKENSSVKFKVAITETLQNGYSFKDLKSKDVKSFERFVSETVGKDLSISQVDDMFLRRHVKPMNEIEINGRKRNIIHYGKDRKKFRIFGYYDDNGYFVLYKIDTEHKTHSK